MIYHFFISLQQFIETDRVERTESDHTHNIGIRFFIFPVGTCLSCNSDLFRRFFLCEPGSCPGISQFLSYLHDVVSLPCTDKNSAHAHRHIYPDIISCFCPSIFLYTDDFFMSKFFACRLIPRKMRKTKESIQYISTKCFLCHS